MKNIREILIKSLDSDITENERKALDAALVNDVDLKSEAAEYVRLRDFMAAYDVAESDGFTDGVMDSF